MINTDLDRKVNSLQNSSDSPTVNAGGHLETTLQQVVSLNISPENTQLNNLLEKIVEAAKKAAETEQKVDEIRQQIKQLELKAVTNPNSKLLLVG